MVIAIRTVLITLALGLVAVIALPFVAKAQTSTAQIVVITQTAGSILPSSANVVVVGTGPSLNGTPTSSGSLTYSSSFSNDSRVVTVIPGSYSVSAPSYSNYSFSYSSDCSGYLTAGQVRTCTITATQGGTAHVNVTVSVINNHGGTRTPNDFVITVSGQNANVSNFQGTSGSVLVSLGSGAYSIDAQGISSYTASRSSDCSGTIASGETRSCLITLTDTYLVYGGNGSSVLTCSPSNQTGYQGQTVSFTASGASGPYTWSTADRTYLAVGPQLNVTLSSVGAQRVYVTNGYQTASCNITILASAGYTGYTGNGVVLGTSTSVPGLPNTGYAPSSLGLILAFLGAFVALPAALFLAYPYAKRTAFAIFG